MATSSIQETQQRIIWMWKSNEWKRYSDIENRMIELAYQQNRNQVELDDFSINLKDLVQTSKNDPNKQEPIKRVTNISSDEYVRKERFTLEHSPNTALFRTQRSFQLACYQTFSTAAWLQRILITMPSDDKLPEFVEQAAAGIEEQGAKLGKQKEAEWIANELRKVKAEGKKEIGECCVKLYTMESFLYELINRFEREAKLKTHNWHDDFDRSYMSVIDTDNYRTLQPYCLLLRDYLEGCPQEKDVVVFRGANLTDEMIDYYKKHIGKLVVWDWLSSTTKNKEIALSSYGNILFQIQIPQNARNCISVAISSLSEYPQEQEVLLDGAEIQIEKVEYDPEINKHVIEILTIGHI